MTPKSDTTTSAIYACVQAYNTRKDHEIMTLWAGTWTGMTSNPMPAWSECDRTGFDTIGAAKQSVPHLSRTGWNFEIIPETIEYVRITTRIVVYETVEPVDADP